MSDVRLENIERGTLVFDRMGRPLGYVDYVQTPDMRQVETDGFMDSHYDNRQRIWDFGEDILELAFEGDDQFDQTLVAQMESYGYIHIVTNDGSGMFAFGDEIDHEENGALFLNIEEHEGLRHNSHQAT